MSATIVWFRQDLRLQDNPALLAAVARGGAVIPVYVLDDVAEAPRAAGGASRWWLHHSLAALAGALRERGAPLILSRGDSSRVLSAMANACGADAVYWNRRFEPSARDQETTVEESLGQAGVAVMRFSSALLHEPDTVRNQQGLPFRVFTPFWRHCLSLPVPAPAKVTSATLSAPPSGWPLSLKLEDLELLPRIRWDAGFSAVWTPGEAAAMERLRAFTRRGMETYAERRNLPGIEGTSLLSPHLHYGEISPRQIWAAVRQLSKKSGVFPPSKGAGAFLSEIGWREFAYHVLFHFALTVETPFREEFERFSWREDPGGAMLRAWQRGRTGYPIVDAGMRQLWHTGWMHNRVRMIAASFLVKHLRLSWVEGANWFSDTLVDADLANNTLGWQWTAGCGVDAAPYFRVFAPVLQGRKFDPDGDYVRRWLPELAALPRQFVHAPWEASEEVLRKAGIHLGDTYPRPIVDHAMARHEALAAFESMRARP